MQSLEAQTKTCAAGIYVSLRGPPKIIKATSEWLDMFGLEAPACVGRTLNTIAGPETDLQRLKHMVEAVRNGRPASGAAIFYTSRGERALYLIRAKPARGLDGMPVCKLTMQRSDAVAFKTAAAEDGSCKLVLSLEKPFRIVSSTDEFERTYGFTREESANRTLGLILGPETDVRGWLALVEHARAGRSQTGTIQTYTREGAALRETVRVTPVLGASDIEFLVATFGHARTKSHSAQGLENACGAAVKWPTGHAERQVQEAGACANETGERQRSMRNGGRWRDGQGVVRVTVGDVKKMMKLKARWVR